MRVGDEIPTLYGDGRLLLYREIDRVYVLELPYGRLYADRSSLLLGSGEGHEMRTDRDEEDEDAALNAAFESLERIRKMNLEIACREKGVEGLDLDQCSCCILSSVDTDTDSSKKLSHGPLSILHHLFDGRSSLFNTSSPCLVCGSPTCHAHESQKFRQQGITVCGECEKLFTQDYVVECLTASTQGERRAHMDKMIDIYDRTMLLLKYSSKYVGTAVRDLERAKIKQNRVGLGSSTAGIVSGALGIAAAATIFTPAGPPLLITSLLFGGSATAVQTGNEVRNRYSDSALFADRLIALYGMLNSVLRVADTLRDALLRDCLRSDTQNETLFQNLGYDGIDHSEEIIAGMTIGRCSLAGLEISSFAAAGEAGLLAGRNARLLQRTAPELLRTARFAQFAGGALSAATLLLEAKCMACTIESIKSGDTCEKALILKRIQEELVKFPDTTSLDLMCENYLEAMAQRKRAMTVEEVTQILQEQSRAFELEMELRASVDLLAESMEREQLAMTELDEDEEYECFQNHTPPPSEADYHSKMTASLLERIETYKKHESSSLVSSCCTSESGRLEYKKPSLLERISRYKEQEAYGV